MTFFFIALLSISHQASFDSIIAVSLHLQKKFNYNTEQRFLLVNIEKQEMYLVKDNAVEKTYRVSTSEETSNQPGSNKTPPGVHRVAEKIGKDAKPNTIFVGRKSTGEIANIITDTVDVKTDHVTSRILWLDGLEDGVNKGKDIDSKQRYIYIHGTHEEGHIGKPVSHGCIRMYNKDVIELFDLVDTGTLVVIAEKVSQ